MKTEFKVNKEFILEAYGSSACAEWKLKLRKQFPDAFKEPRRANIVVYREWGESGFQKHQNFRFAVGDTVKVTDGSYNEDTNGKSRSGVDSLFQNNKAVILATETGKVLNVNNFISNKFMVTVNLLLQFPDGTLVYCAPNCVRLIEDGE